MKPRSGAGTRCIIPLDWLIADSTAGRRNGFPHLRSGPAGKYARRLWWRMARIRREKRVKSWLLDLSRIFFVHRRARRRLISSSAEAISVDSKPKLRSRINSLDMTWNRDLSDANWITHNTRFRLYSSRAITDSSGVGWLLATYVRLRVSLWVVSKKILIHCKWEKFVAHELNSFVTIAPILYIYYFFKYEINKLLHRHIRDIYEIKNIFNV